MNLYQIIYIYVYVRTYIYNIGMRLLVKVDFITSYCPSLLHILHHYFILSITTSYRTSLLHIVHHYFISSITTSYRTSLLHILHHYFISSITTSYRTSLLHIAHHYFISYITMSYRSESITTSYRPSLCTSHWSLSGFCACLLYDCVSGSSIGGASSGWDEITTCVLEEQYHARVRRTLHSNSCPIST